MGGSAASYLESEGFDVHGHDVSPAAREAAAEHGVTVGETAAAVSDEVDVVVTSLPTPDIVKDVYVGEDGILDGSGDSLAAIEISTIDPDTTEQVASAAADAGVQFVDAPVSGGPEAASDGTLTMMLGGEEDVLDTPPVEPVIDALANPAYYVGETGAGHTAKLLNNVMSMGNLMLAMEAVAMGVDRGLNGEHLLDVLSNASGSSNQFEKRLPRALNRNFEPGFAVERARKDIGLALEAADRSDHSMPVTSLIHQLYVRAVQEGYGEEDATAVAKLFEGDTLIESAEQVDEYYEGY
jgi:3-hydroxyisobutyrate dehydrogenase-like beta-hydroxyacid dehydrogenase